MGCGVGTWLSVFRERGVAEILGIDGSYVDPAYSADSGRVFPSPRSDRTDDVPRRFDLAISLEVAEHLPPSSSGSFVDQLTGLSGIVLFSAAIPGEAEPITSTSNGRVTGEGFSMSGAMQPSIACGIDSGMTRRFKLTTGRTCFSTSTANCSLTVPTSRPRRSAVASIPSDLVHPLLLEFVRAHPPKLSKLIGALPGAIRQSVNWHLGRGR